MKQDRLILRPGILTLDTKTLDIQIQPQKVFYGCFRGPNTFSAGVWMSRENDGPWKMYLLSKNGCVGYLKRDHFSRNTSEPF